MEELTATVQSNARSAEQAGRVVQGAAEIATRGGEAVDRVVGSMAAISSSSRKVQEIVGVIDEIAFQTNILALNAAVEAARAGEQGRGFAVVASEVRTLAMRSSRAAKEIRGLIAASAQRVEDGATQVEEAGRTMGEMSIAVKRVTDIMGEILVASREQATGIDQIGKAVAQLDQITQRNASLVEDVTAGTQTVARQTDGLDAAVKVFNVSSGVVRGGASERPEPAPRPLKLRSKEGLVVG